jgi:hypothetical protein
MNEFEWRRQMRELRQPVAPPHDLWNRIDAALDGAATTTNPARRPHYWPAAIGIAAMLVLAGWLGGRLQQRLQPLAAPVVASAPQPWKPADPRLAGAAIELTAAQIELRQALQQAPNSPALRQLLANTERQQASLRQLERQAG